MSFLVLMWFLGPVLGILGADGKLCRIVTKSGIEQIEQWPEGLLIRNYWYYCRGLVKVNSDLGG